MSERKTTAINLRMSQDVKELLRLAAAQQHRTLSNMLEFLILQHCEQQGLRLNASESNSAAVESEKQGAQ
ncbi:ribbon-helix-helix domain-containing protein [Burkholderia multivorans]|uniref:ribbon-helix-helix domain-containing protein n=1 Tax=Burkholderia multivorans TaxID=87883 RepID=UPI001C267F98|nr:DUF1778 domain-containing protein [Burkholderia multivorans]MBU9576474.1 DUF1778 domain-containing protein [Burkholderia multivorans]